jgi:peptidoglycan/LPS O-acetylase OafA/YrhL
MRNVVTLLGGYLVVSVMALVAAFVFRDDPTIVNTAVWIRGTAVALSALLALRFARRAEAGNRRMVPRLRIITAVMLAAIVVIIALPGTFPVWMKFEQGICGLLLLPVVIMLNRRSVRQA